CSCAGAGRRGRASAGPRLVGAGDGMNAYVTGGWSATVVILSLYAWRTVRRGGRLARMLPPEDQPWR
ncbi:MAG: hypothetical protein ACYC1D_15475, partial [Acidimicrobiales bacterium]